MARVVCAGHVNWDITLKVDRLPDPDGEAAIRSQHQSGGGSASNAAVVFAGLGVDTHLLGSVGTDEHAWLARRELKNSGVETHLVEGNGPTSVKYLVVGDDGEVMVLGTDGGNEAYTAGDLPAGVLANADFLHLTNQAPETAAELARKATEVDVPVSFDPGRRITDRDYDDTIAMTDVIFLNTREFDDCANLAEVPVVVRKQGSNGGTVRTEAETVEHPGFDVDPVDTTGAGDAFDAGFLAARLDDHSYADALAIANACGALAARTTGAHLHVGWSDVEAMLDVGPAETS